MALIAQIALGVIIDGLTIALLVMGFFVWNGRQRNDRLAVRLFIAGARLTPVNYHIRQRIRARSETVIHWLMIITAKAPSLSFVLFPVVVEPSPERRLKRLLASWATPDYEECIGAKKHLVLGLPFLSHCSVKGSNTYRIG